MPDYKRMYGKLFNQITDTIETLEKELDKLKRIQQITEEIYIKSEETEDDDKDN
ncbi:MAG: hypothetical protein RR540_03005 [Oscillospiraceae bacterium]